MIDTSVLPIGAYILLVIFAMAACINLAKYRMYQRALIFLVVFVTAVYIMGGTYHDIFNPALFVFNTTNSTGVMINGTN